jgi:hypothetical protein
MIVPNGANAARITVPTLLMVGAQDNVATAFASETLYNQNNIASTGLGAISKTLVKMDCASHAIFFETCITPGSRVCNNSKGLDQDRHDLREPGRYRRRVRHELRRRELPRSAALDGAGGSRRERALTLPEERFDAGI